MSDGAGCDRTLLLSHGTGPFWQVACGCLKPTVRLLQQCRLRTKLSRNHFPAACKSLTLRRKMGLSGLDGASVSSAITVNYSAL